MASAPFAYILELPDTRPGTLLAAFHGVRDSPPATSATAYTSAQGPTIATCSGVTIKTRPPHIPANELMPMAQAIVRNLAKVGDGVSPSKSYADRGKIVSAKPWDDGAAMMFFNLLAEKWSPASILPIDATHALLVGIAESR